MQEDLIECEFKSFEKFFRISEACVDQRGAIRLCGRFWLHSYWQLLYCLQINISEKIRLYQKKCSSGSKHSRSYSEVSRSIISKWNPQELVSKTKPINEVLKIDMNEDHYLWLKNGSKIINMSGFDVYGLGCDNRIKKTAVDIIKSYGVGSCGPRNFFGTCFPHIEFEQNAAKIFGYDACIFYSFGFSTISSTISACITKQDVVFVDEMVNISIKKGIEISRCRCFYYRHNDINHLEDLLIKNSLISTSKFALWKKTQKIYLIIEGIFFNTGEICKLPQIVKLKSQFNFRIICDETVSIGTLGPSGLGVSDYFGIENGIDILTAQTELVFGQNGGFTCGSNSAIDHQRLFGPGYTFSASSPPFIPSVLSTSLNIIINEDQKFKFLQEKCSKFTNAMDKIDSVFELHGSRDSLLKYITFNDEMRKSKSLPEQYEDLQSICNISVNKNEFALSVATFEEDIIPMDMPSNPIFLKVPRIRIVIKPYLTDIQIDDFVTFISNASHIY